MIKDSWSASAWPVLSAWRIAGFTGMMLMASTLAGLAEERSASSPQTLPESASHRKHASEVTVDQRQAEMLERRNEAVRLSEVLQNPSTSPEDKRKAVEEFRAKRQAWQGEGRANVRERSAEEKAASQQRMKEWISSLPEERREEIESRLAIHEEMEKLQAEEKSLTPEVHQQRMQELLVRRKAMMQKRVAAAEAETARTSKESDVRQKTSQQQAMEAEREKLNAALATGDPEKRRAAMESFRAATGRMREARLQGMEQRWDGNGVTRLPPKEPAPPASRN